MNTISRNVCDIPGPDRQALEHFIGERLGDDQQVIVSVRPAAMTGEERQAFDAEIASWEAASDEDFKSFMDDLEK